MASENILTLGTDNFDEAVTKSTKPVLVDFWAEWCGPCKMIAPVLDELASEYADKVTIGKVNIDQYQDLAVKFGIRSIPTLLLFSGGEVKEQIVGMQSKGDLKAKLDASLS